MRTPNFVLSLPVKTLLCTVGLGCLLVVSAVHAEQAQHKLMVGTPPSIASQVTFKNYRHYPFNKWAFHNIGAALNVVAIAREGDITSLREKPLAELGKLTLKDGFGNRRSVEQILAANDTDAFVVLRDNLLLFERYYSGMNRHDQHIWFSMTKSLVSTALGILVEEGKIDLAKSPADYIEELKGSGFERATIQQVLNHSSALAFEENYTDVTSDFLKYYGPALNMAYIPGGRDAQPETTDIYGVHNFLQKFVRPDSSLEPGEAFDYNSANADVAGWLVARVSGMPLQDFIQQKIWSRLGAEHDALIAVDRAFMPVATGGMASTLRDAALFGQMILNRGRVGDKQVVPAHWVDQSVDVSSRDRKKMADNPKYKNDSWEAYKNMWWILDARQGEYAAVGVHGQVIYINRSANVVVAWFSSQPAASAAGNRQFASKLLATQAIAGFLKGIR